MTSLLGPALGVCDYRRWWVATLATWMALQMIDVAIGWQIYAQHHSTLYLGLVGLLEFVPMFVLALPAGHLADRVERRLLFAFALVLGAAIGAGLCLLSTLEVRSLAPYLLLALAIGVASALLTPSSWAMVPNLVPVSLLPSAVTLSTVSSRAASVLGPALGGALFAASPVAAYGTAGGICLGGALSVLTIKRAPAAVEHASQNVRDVLEGLHFVLDSPILLGAMLLDLLGVLFGGALALLPVFASSILHVGPTGLGFLRASPAVGALLGATILTRRPLNGRLGRTLLVVVAAFGASILVFGVSRAFPLSLIALGVSGFVDVFSMNIRSLLSTYATPDRLRGRVSAVEMVFISASNELGAFESGVAAALIGTVPAVLAGGVLTIALALGWRWTFPALARIDRPTDIPGNWVADATPSA
ncbi:MAG TPA: MFS transporter [Solirubrobacteraceae bacterium]|nr:MFS transporter [Solirubrobacteraceae bacterium]